MEDKFDKWYRSQALAKTNNEFKLFGEELITFIKAAKRYNLYETHFLNMKKVKHSKTSFRQNLIIN